MKSKNVVSIIFIVGFIMVGVYFIFSTRISVKYEPNFTLEDYYNIPIKKVGINEYKMSTVTWEDMVKIYFNNYMTLFFEDIDESYNYLDEEVKSKKFQSIDIFKNKVMEITKNFEEMPKIKEYNIDSDGDIKIITIIDQNGYQYVFNIEGVMKYTVVL